MTIRMWTDAMTRARSAWEDQSEALHGPLRNLSQAEPLLLGSRVAPAASAFLSTWESRVDALRRAASDHADALAGASYDIHSADAEAVQAVQELLTWPHRDTPPFSYGRTP
jgi:hypothetical protein